MLVADPAMHRVLELADRAAPTNLTVLLLGESGTGKEMLARYVHEHSPRRAERMVSLNCGGFPESLLDSELFGYEKGAFTGASSPKQGLFEAADGGTLFLDEVAELTPALQVKLLRVLEDRKVLRIGAVEPRTVDVRFIAVTNVDLEAHVAAGRFREDLYYRLYGVPVFIPPLRQRREDIVPLAERFLADSDLGARRTLSNAAKDKLRGYDWPGNVRQLKNVMNRALVMAGGRDITPQDIDLRDREVKASVPPVDETPEVLRARAEDAEKRRILDALDECAGRRVPRSTWASRTAHWSAGSRSTTCRGRAGTRAMHAMPTRISSDRGPATPPRCRRRCSSISATGVRSSATGRSESAGTAGCSSERRR